MTTKSPSHLAILENQDPFDEGLHVDDDDDDALLTPNSLPTDGPYKDYHVPLMQDMSMAELYDFMYDDNSDASQACSEDEVEDEHHSDTPDPINSPEDNSLQDRTHVSLLKLLEQIGSPGLCMPSTMC